MSLELSTQMNDKMRTVYVGDLTLVFSYETLIAFAVPGVGRVSCENIWASTTGKHLNSFPAQYNRIPRGVFTRAATILDHSLKGNGTRQGLVSRLNRLLKGFDS